MENHPEKSLVDCNPKGFNFQENKTTPEGCSPSPDSLDFLEDSFRNEKTNLGKSNLGDPMQTGHILNDGTNFNTIYRYSKALRGADEAVMDLFKDIVVLDEDGKAHRVPIIWGSQEKAVAAIVQDNVRKDNSLVVDRIRLPILAIRSQDYQFNQGRYVYHKALDYARELRPDQKPGRTIKEKHERDTILGMANGIPIDISYSLYAWTMYIEDMNQILEQIILKFSPFAYIKVRGVAREIQVKLDSIANNLEIEPGNQAIRVVKFQFNLTAESFIPQPIVRKKSILTTRIELTEGLKEEDIKEIINRIEETVKETKC
jgi:hypothetical protein